MDWCLYDRELDINELKKRKIYKQELKKMKNKLHVFDSVSSFFFSCDLVK